MPRKGSNLFTRISNGYNNLTASEKKLADYVLAHKTDVQYMSISELADECKVGEATVSRFCKSLNLKGYNDFKLAIAKSEMQSNTGADPGMPNISEAGLPEEDNISRLARSLYVEHTATLAQTMAMVKPEEIERAVDVIMSSENVYCMGQGGSMILAMETSHLMSTIMPNFSYVLDSHLQASKAAIMTEKDTVFFFSYSGSTKEIVELIKLARQSGAKIILITRFLKSPGANLADIVLQCGANESPLMLGSVSAKIAQLYIVDLLYSEICRRDPEGTRDNKERIARALVEKHI